MARPNRNSEPRVIEAKERAARALELRKEGKTFQEIADEPHGEGTLYASKQSAYDAVKRAMQDLTREPASELLELELARLDSMWGIHYLNAMAGDVQALDACMKIMQRRAKMLGIDAPAESRTELTGPGGEAIQFPTVIELVGVQPKQITSDGTSEVADTPAG